MFTLAVAHSQHIDSGDVAEGILQQAREELGGAQPIDVAAEDDPRLETPLLELAQQYEFGRLTLLLAE